MYIKAEVRHSFNTTTVLEQYPRLHHKGASARIACDSRMAVGFLTRATCKNV